MGTCGNRQVSSAAVLQTTLIVKWVAKIPLLNSKLVWRQVKGFQGSEAHLGVGSVLVLQGAQHVQHPLLLLLLLPQRFGRAVPRLQISKQFPFNGPKLKV